MNFGATIATALACLCAGAHAEPDYTIVFDLDAGAPAVEEATARVRELSRETGSGKVNVNQRGNRAVADLSAAAAAEVEKLRAVKIVEPEILYFPCSTALDVAEGQGVARDEPASVAALENEDRTVVLAALSTDARVSLIADIQRLSLETGSGFVLVIADDALFANLSDAAAEKVVAMTGVVHVSRGRLSMQRQASGPG